MTVTQILFTLLLIATQLFLSWRVFALPTFRFVEAHGPSGDMIMTVEVQGRWLMWRWRRLQVRGSCTVWHYYPSGGRVGSLGGEGALCDFWQAEEWRRKDAKK